MFITKYSSFLGSTGNSYIVTTFIGICYINFNADMNLGFSYTVTLNQLEKVCKFWISDTTNLISYVPIINDFVGKNRRVLWKEFINKMKGSLWIDKGKHPSGSVKWLLIKYSNCVPIYTNWLSIGDVMIGA